VFSKLLLPNPLIATEVITDGPLFPNKFSSNCPAIMFVVRHTTTVRGRIRLLIDQWRHREEWRLVSGRRRQLL